MSRLHPFLRGMVISGVIFVFSSTIMTMTTITRTCDAFHNSGSMLLPHNTHYYYRQRDRHDDFVSLFAISDNNQRKGFSKKKNQKKNSISSSPPTLAPPSSSTPHSRVTATDVDDGTTTTTTKTISSAITPPKSSSTSSSSSSNSREVMNAGQAALAQMRRERADLKEREQQQVKDLRQTDAQIESGAQPTAIPEIVAQRMGARMLPFVGVPLLGLMSTFVAFWYLRTYQNVQFIQPGLVATLTLLFLGLGLFGITYSVMSVSWDENPLEDGEKNEEKKKKKNDLLGWEEFQRNVDIVKEGLSRSRDNAVIRDRMTNEQEEE